MRSFKVVIATLILFGGIWVNLNPDLVNTTYNFDDSDENPDLVGLQENEHWLVIRVAFPSMPHSLSETESLLLGPDSAQEYISQLSGGVSNLEVTISDEVWISDFEESYWGADSQNERDVGNGGSGVDKLVEESALDLLSGMDLSQWDINGDGVIMRLEDCSFLPMEQDSHVIGTHLLTDRSGVVISLNKWASLAGAGKLGSLKESVATDVINSSLATCATIAVVSLTGAC